MVCKKIAQWTSAEKVLVQKSGYFARSAAPNKNDIDLIDKISKKAVSYSLNKKSGVAGLSDDYSNQVKCIDFKDIKKKATCKVAFNNCSVYLSTW